jgi:glutaminyl-peptide cyclotransferase
VLLGHAISLVGRPETLCSLAAVRRLGSMLAVLALALASCGGESNGGPGQPGDGRFDADRAFRDLRAQVRIGPRPAGSAASRQEARWIVRRLREAGVPEVRVQHPYRNVVGHIPGTAAGTVVVGAHHDTKDIPGFVGANDGASGVAVLLELARSLPRRLHGPSIELVFFDAEEARGETPFELDGARGSSQFVRYSRGRRQGSAALAEIRAMVLFDLVGDCDLELPREENSDPDLYGLFSDAASQVGGGDASPLVGTTEGILDDHIPFAQAGIPSVGLIDFQFGRGPVPGAFWHTLQDDLDHVCARSLDAVGEAALVAIPRIQ